MLDDGMKMSIRKKNALLLHAFFSNNSMSIFTEILHTNVIFDCSKINRSFFFVLCLGGINKADSQPDFQALEFISF